MLDFILEPLSTIAQWVGYGLIASFIVGSLFLLVAIPVMFKMAAVAFARVLVVETTKVISHSGLTAQFSNAVTSISRATNELTNEIKKQNAQKQKFEVRVVDEIEVRK